MQESVGVQCKPIKLIEKVLLRMKYYACMSFGVSSTFYRKKNNILVGTDYFFHISRLVNGYGCITMKMIALQVIC